MTWTVGVVVPSLVQGGGVPEVARFLCEVIEESSQFDARLFSIPSSSRDPDSVRLMAPRSWLRGPKVREGVWADRMYEHVGAWWAEFEFQRYRPRDALTRRLDDCDLVQVVAGTPAWGLVASDASIPVALQVATLASVERAEYFRQEEGPLMLWRRSMTWLTDRLDRTAVDAADRIFVENEWMEQELCDWTESDKVVRAHPGVDATYFHPREETNFDAGYILSVGRFADRRKNVPFLFRGYAHLSEIYESPPELVLAGRSGPTEQDWKLASDLGIRNQVRFHHDVSRDRLAQLYRDAALFVLPSSEEGLGIVLLEAMASGIPVVSTSTAGALETVVDGETGFVTPTDQTRTFAEAVSRLLENGRRRGEMGRAARRRVERHFSHEATARRFLDEYRALIELDRTDSEDNNPRTGVVGDVSDVH